MFKLHYSKLGELSDFIYFVLIVHGVNQYSCYFIDRELKLIDSSSMIGKDNIIPTIKRVVTPYGGYQGFTSVKDPHLKHDLENVLAPKSLV
jgi:hypothetical protein